MATETNPAAAWTPSATQLAWLASENFTATRSGEFTTSHVSKYSRTGEPEIITVCADATGEHGSIHPDQPVWNVYINCNGGTSCQTATAGGSTLAVAMRRAIKLAA